MRKYFTLYFIIFSLCSSQFSYSQDLKENERLVVLGKVWGYLKYYHPNVAKGEINWKNEGLNKIKEVGETNNKKDFNNLLVKWINDLGDLSINNIATKEIDESDIFEKNFNLDWINDKRIFSDKTIKILTDIRENRSQGKNRYVDERPLQFFENDSIVDFPAKEERLITLFTYWNIVEYFYPYKYLTDEKWDNVLKDMIPIFIDVKNIQEYHLALLALITKLDDSHAYLYSQEITNYFGDRTLPLKIQYIQGKLFVNELLYKDSCIRKGAIINTIDNKSTSEIINKLSKHIPASNSIIKIRNAQTRGYFMRTNKDSLTLEIQDINGLLKEVKCPTYPLEQLQMTNDKNVEKWKKIDNDIGYIDVENLNLEDAAPLVDFLKNTKALIIDYRGYPKNGVAKLLYNVISSGTNSFWSGILPDLNYPGKYIWKKDFLIEKESDYTYEGIVVVLVNEMTQSYAETGVMMLQSTNKVITIGSTTSGANGNVVRFKIGGLDTGFSGLGFFYPDGQQLQRKGVKIDFYAKPTLNGLKEEKDEILLESITLIKEKLNKL